MKRYDVYSSDLKVLFKENATEEECQELTLVYGEVVCKLIKE